MKNLNINNSRVITIKNDVSNINEKFKEIFDIIPKYVHSMNTGKIISKIILNEYSKNLIFKNFDNGYINYCENKPYWLGCSIGHYMAIMIAKELKLPYIIIFEDDIIFEDNIVNDLYDAWSVLPENFDTFVFGYDKKNMNIIQPNPIEYNKLLFNGKGFKFCGAHSYIVNECAYDKILYLLDNIYVADVAINDDSLNCFYTKNSLCNQPQFKF